MVGTARSGGQPGISAARSVTNTRPGSWGSMPTNHDLKMKRKHLSFPILLLALAAVSATTIAAYSGKGVPSTTTSAAADPVRGRYLVEQVGLCTDCHSPRDEKGQFVADRWLKGGPIPFTPTVPMPFANAAPQIAGLPSLTDEQALHFLTAGVLPGGRLPRPPMPPYRFTPDDARDVIAYLRAPIAPVADHR